VAWLAIEARAAGYRGAVGRSRGSRVHVAELGRPGLALLPFGLSSPTAVTIECFTLGGAIYGPFVPLSVTLMQAKSPPQHLAPMLAARSAVLLTASPLGTALGGPLTTALGPRATLGGSGLATVVLGAVACVLLLARRRNQ
jgi:predicted MFS family arabinose efflux permease